MKRTTACMTAVMLACCACATLAAESPPCAEGWFSIRARIVRIEPLQARVTVRPTAGPLRSAGMDDRLCSGDTIENTSATRLVLLEAGRSVDVTSLSYRVGAGPAVAAAAAQYVAEVFDLVGGLRPPVPRAMPTGTRGGENQRATYERVRPLLALRDLPRQKLTADEHVLLAWRGGAAPYRCQGYGDDTVLNWQSVGTTLGWCDVAGALGATSRLTVEDGRGASTGWNLQRSTWDQVPRPPWVAPRSAAALAPERVAWAAWLWRSGGREWRLQAMAMLNTLSATEPLAAELLDRIVDENLPAEP